MTGLDNSTRPTAAVALSLDEDSLRRLAHLVAAEVQSMITHTMTSGTNPETWLDSKAAARYLGFDGVHPLHKLTARREIAFSQDTAGGKTWFRRTDLDEYRLRSYVEAGAARI
jgi:hypothetical protein